ncbi:MAG: 30S ribosomal protein S14 [Pseudomonadota bacterium]|nr:30S ribosomal protein S14 [Pseudomonadota bacterium]
MAKVSMVNRDQKRLRLVQKYATKRAKLKAIIVGLEYSFDEKEDARVRLQKLPRDSSKSRVRNRCSLTGRPHGYYRKFGLSRNELRRLAMEGHIPGLVKASW